MEQFDYFVFGLSTWYDGQLQSYWDSFFETFCEMDFMWILRQYLVVETKIAMRNILWMALIF
jgi:flavodoxin